MGHLWLSWCLTVLRHLSRIFWLNGILPLDVEEFSMDHVWQCVLRSNRFVLVQVLSLS